MTALIGAHLSVAGGLHKAMERAALLQCTAVQIFTKNANQWKGKPLTTEDVRRFKDARRKAGVRYVCSHASYLINVASPDRAARDKSMHALIDELERAEMLGLEGVVLHPGARVGQEPDVALQHCIQSINQALEATEGYRSLLLIEGTAGQGSTLASRFDEWAAILDGLNPASRVGACFDTCHAFAAGYELRDEAGWQATWRGFDEAVGIGRLRLLHVNDSQRDLGSHVDRHASLGDGLLGMDAFRLLMQDPRLTHIPKILETPKGDQDDLDALNLALLRHAASDDKNGFGTA